MNSEHLDFIIKDLHKRGILLDELRDEIIDHVYSAVEVRMNNGERFIDAYDEVIKSFGNTKGLHQTQKEIMLRNYITTALRQMSRGRLYTFINLVTLSIGITAVLLIALYVHHELSYDRWSENADRTYRVDIEIKFNENHVILASCPPPMAQTMQHDYPEIESTVRFVSLGSYLVRRAEETENSREDNVRWTDSTFFKVFPVPVLKGDARTALAEANSIAISRKMADKYFPDGDALGRSLTLDNRYTGKVTAVYEDIPEASHFHFDILVAMVGSWPTAKRALSTEFMDESFNTYVVLKENSNAKALEAKLPAFVNKYIGATFSRALGSDFTMEKFLADGNKYEATLMPLTDIHLKSDKLNEFEGNSSMAYVYLFEVIGFLILAIACVNFMNLSTARATGRAREVGVRKAMGSLRTSLIRLFLTESIAFAFISALLAMLMSWAIMPLFNQLASKELIVPFGNPSFYLWLLVCVLIVGTLAGLYPAFIISAFKTSEVLKGKAQAIGGSVLRNGLVVFQFVISVLLIVGTITVNRQLNYIQNKKLGFDKSHVITVNNGYALRPKAESFKTEALRLAGIESGTMTGYVPVKTADAYRSAYSMWTEGKAPVPENFVNLQNWKVDEDYVATFDMEVIKGRAFSKNKSADSRSIILNETAVKLFGLGDDPVGKRLKTFSDLKDQTLNKDSLDTYTVIGVVRDFHYSSLKENINPLAFTLGYQDGSFSFRFKGSQTAEVIGGLEKIWRQISPGEPFQYSFVDEDFGKMYAGEQQLSNIFQVFAILAIIIACIGLFALTAFTAEQRTKEIGIRKVLGASVPGIVVLLSKEFGKLILIAFFIAMPVAWYGVNWWLTGYSYKTEIGVWVYLLAGVIITFIAIMTMSYQSIRAALMNPIKSLRSE